MSTMSYMGTKRAFAPFIAASVSGLPEGPVLELFGGMSAVGRALACERNVWVNDTQAFARTVCEFQFLNLGFPQNNAGFAHAWRQAFRRNMTKLLDRFGTMVERETEALSSGEWSRFCTIDEEIRERTAAYAAAGGRRRPRSHYALFSQQYGATYFGLRQSMQLDSIRYAIDQTAGPEDADRFGMRAWMLAALGGAMLRTANSTGHFAQYLTPRLENFHRVLPKRRRSLTRAFSSELHNVRPAGDDGWRAQNKVYRADACALLRRVAREGVPPAVIYADPPYTDDQYSRFYHLLDTMIIYDYPKTNGKGRYRDGRFVSDWSLSAKVASSFETLAQLSSAVGCALMVSYPDNGLLKNSSQAIPEILRRHYRSVDLLHSQTFQHSTMGASKGAQKAQVVEQLFLAR